MIAVFNILRPTVAVTPRAVRATAEVRFDFFLAINDNAKASLGYVDY